MGVFKIPSPNPTLPKNGFDLSSRRVFSAPAGALLPVGCWETNPNEHFQISVQDLVRTQPLNTAAYTRCKEYYHFFFVPYKSLWRFSDQFFTGVSNGDSAFFVPVFKGPDKLTDDNDNFNWTPKTLPHFDFSKLLDRFYNGQRKDALGYSFSNGAFRLLNLLEYGVTCDGEMVDYSKLSTPLNGISYSKNPSSKGLTCTPNPFRLFAYQRIYNDFYRNQQWEKSDVFSFNCDYAQDDPHLDLTLDAIEAACTLRYRQWPKDWLTSSIPSANYDEGIFNLPSYLGNVGSSVTRLNTGDGVVINTSDSTDHDGRVSFGGSASIAVNDIRAAFALDKMLEVTRRANGLDYSSQIAAHFGFKVPESRRNCAQFIGGFDNQVVVDEVTATANGSVSSGSSSSSSVVGQVFGKGIGSMNSNVISYDTKEHGIIMCIYSVVPQVDYNSFYMSNFNRKLTREQFFQPEFQNLGYVPLSGYDMVLTTGADVNKASSHNNATLGYVPRYQEYKTGRDVVFGEFISGKSLSAWTTPRIDLFRSRGDLVNLTPSDFMIDPKVLDSVFSVSYDGHSKFDQFLINSFFNVKAVRPMSVTGLSPI